MKAQQSLENGWPEEFIVDGELPASLHTSLVSITGGVTTALLLSHAIKLSLALGEEADGWFTLSAEQCQEATGLSDWEQEAARRVLRVNGFLAQQRRGDTRTLWFHVRIWLVLSALRYGIGPRLH
jgi:hypothetical protein